MEDVYSLTDKALANINKKLFKDSGFQVVREDNNIYLAIPSTIKSIDIESEKQDNKGFVVGYSYRFLCSATDIQKLEEAKIEFSTWYKRNYVDTLTCQLLGQIGKHLPVSKMVKYRKKEAEL